MIDPLATIIAYLDTDANLNMLIEHRIAAKHKFGSGWEMPSKALQVRYDGGLADLDVEWQQPRLEARCYGEDQEEASKVYRALVAITRTTTRVRVGTGDGFGLLYFLLPTSGPSFFTDPDSGVDMILVFMQAAIAEMDIP